MKKCRIGAASEINYRYKSRICFRSPWDPSLSPGRPPSKLFWLKDRRAADIVVKNSARLRTETCYCSLYDECWRALRSILTIRTARRNTEGYLSRINIRANSPFRGPDTKTSIAAVIAISPAHLHDAIRTRPRRRPARNALAPTDLPTSDRYRIPDTKLGSNTKLGSRLVKIHF